MCTDTAIHRRQAGQECSWTITECETTAAPRFTTPLFGLFIVCCPPMPFSSLSGIYKSCYHFYLCPVILCCHGLMLFWFPFYKLYLKTQVISASAVAQLVPLCLWGYHLEWQWSAQPNKQRMMRLLKNPPWVDFSCEFHTKRQNLDIKTIQNQKIVNKTTLFQRFF